MIYRKDIVSDATYLLIDEMRGNCQEVRKKFLFRFQEIRKESKGRRRSGCTIPPVKRRHTRRTHSKRAQSAHANDVGKGMLLFIGASILVVFALEHPYWALFIVVAIVASVFGYSYIKAQNEAARERAFLDMIERKIEFHVASLARKRMQLVVKDAYGKPKLQHWLKERDYFMQEHVASWVPIDQRGLFVHFKGRVESMIEEKSEREAASHPPLSEFNEDMTPIEFEAFCASELCAAGWDARTTMQSRDQGVDVIAEKRGFRVVVQCKLYTRPVGNKAVQEVTAAKDYEKAACGVVVSNHRYTSEAEELATANHILLLHYRDLKNLDRMVGLRAQAASASPSPPRSLEA